jgi:hypothetical protein
MIGKGVARMAVVQEYSFLFGDFFLAGRNIAALALS